MSVGIHKAIGNGLFGQMAHVSPKEAFEEFDWALASKRPCGAFHSVWEIVHHLIFWQDYCLRLLEGEDPVAPKHASESWACTEGPIEEQEWTDAVGHFLAGLTMAEQAARADLTDSILARPQESRIEVLQSLIGHNSYHLGQLVTLRQLLSTWPPPSGGDTW